MIIRHSKVNNYLFIMNPAVTYEMDYYIFDQEIIYILLRAEKMQNRNFLRQSGKRNLDNIIDP